MFELGNNLREARQRRRIDLVAAEQDTKIRSKYLAALETEDFDVLPGPVFVRGFLRTYSRYLGLDPQRFIDEYNARFGRFEDVEELSSGHVLGRPGLAHERERRGRRTMRLVLVATLLVLAVLAWVALREEGPSTPSEVQPHIARTSTDPLPSSTSNGGDLRAAVDAASGPSGASATRPNQRAKQAASQRAKQSVSAQR